MTETNHVTEAALEYLSLRGWKVWRQNNTHVRGRTFHGLKGVPDIIGFNRKNGRFIGVEVKTGDDRQSPEQEQFETEAKKSGARYEVISRVDDLVKAGL